MCSCALARDEGWGSGGLQTRVVVVVKDGTTEVLSPYLVSYLLVPGLREGRG